MRSNTMKNYIKNSQILRPIAAKILELGYWIKDAINPKHVIKQLEEYQIEVLDTSPFKHMWCGYYDVTPFRPENPRQILVHCNNLANHVTPNIKHTTSLGVYDRDKRAIHIFDETRAWNWQQGSRLQWVNKDTIVYNKYEQELTGVAYNLANGLMVKLPCSVNICHRDQYCLTLGFKELTLSSEYGYPGMVEDRCASAIHQYDFKSRNIRRLADYQEIAEASKLLPGALRFHVNHLLPNPEGDKVVFIARCWHRARRFDSLFVYLFNGSRLQLLVQWQTVSHYAWLNSVELLVWAIIGGTGGYFLINVETNEVRLVIKINDGHPNLVSAGVFITDIVEDWRSYIIKLRLMSLEGKCRDLLALSHPRLLKGTNRCDMHVSLSQDKSEFQVDSRHMGFRTVVIGRVPGFHEEPQ